jgi:hypothetical protein
MACTEMREYEDTKCGDEDRGVLDEGGNIGKGSIGIRSMRVWNICKVGGIQSDQQGGGGIEIEYWGSIFSILGMWTHPPPLS